jgi:predicted HD phosphohydrolase
VRVRVWDDRAKQAGAATPPLRHYLDLAERLSARS